MAIYGHNRQPSFALSCTWQCTKSISLRSPVRCLRGPNPPIRQCNIFIYLLAEGVTYQKLNPCETIPVRLFFMCCISVWRKILVHLVYYKKIKILLVNNSHLLVVFRIEDTQTVGSIKKVKFLNWVFFKC
jgi:hypothetical protein